ncbi:restriction endonuclease subunit S [Micromonospora sp. WMMD812]|uniref:restriction endonuclease subunit S n=1 Tax=Micromonospora sp. WMMD812 TaxID=3015152 RepID=UPI00248BAA3B|nr:restriction endonuclease subunit S [Micromonospora sp. WMMD812]WBB70595.1 restriction endonuclease subunit S [Micromonospora sp. WMMD812]
MRGFGKGAFARETIRGDETSYRFLNRLHSGNIILSRLKAFEGAIALVPDELDGFYASVEFPTFEVNEDAADIRYMKHLCTWPKFWQKLQVESKGIGARRERVSAQSFLAIDVPLPDLREQRRIAAKLDTTIPCLTRINALRERSVEIVEQYADALLRPIEECAPLSAALHPSSDFVEVHPDGIYQTAGILNRGRGLFRRPAISGRETKYTRYNRLHTGQFVYSKLFGWEGSLAVVPSDFEGVYVSHEFPTFNIDPSAADVEYMGHLARWPGLHDALRDKGTGMGSRRQRVNVDRLLATEIPLPPLPQQRRIARQLTMVRRAVELGTEQTAHLTALRTASLNAAFAGNL